MKWLHLAMVPLLPVTYIGCAMLLGTLLGSKAQYTPVPLDQTPHYAEVMDIYEKYQLDKDYPPQRIFQVADADTTQSTFQKNEEFIAQVADKACVDQRITFPEERMLVESSLVYFCQVLASRSPEAMNIMPEPYTAFRMCKQQSLAPSLRVYQNGKLYILWNPEACLETAAKAIKWKGYFDLKDACLAGSRSYEPTTADQQGRIARTCVFQSLESWAAGELKKCKVRAQGTVVSCD